MGRYTSQNMPMFSPWPEIWQLLSNIESLEGLPPTSFCSQYNILLSPMLNSSPRKLNNTDPNPNLGIWHYMAICICITRLGEEVKNKEDQTQFYGGTHS